MKYRFCHWWLKLLAWLLAAVCLVFAFWSGDILLSVDRSGQFVPVPYQESRLCTYRVRQHSYEIINEFRRDPSFEKWDMVLEDSPLRFIILEESSGTVRASYTDGLDLNVPKNLKDNYYLNAYNYSMERGPVGSGFEKVYAVDAYFNSVWLGDASIWYESPAADSADDSPEEAAAQEDDPIYQLLLMLPTGALANTKNDIAQGYQIYHMWLSWQDTAWTLLPICLVGFLLAAIFLLIQTGRRPEKDELTATWVDKIWLEVILAVGALGFGGAIGCQVILADAYYITNLTLLELRMLMALCIGGSVLCGLVTLLCLQSVIVRLKMHRFWSSSLCGRFLARIWKWVRKPVSKVWDTVCRGAHSIDAVPAAVLSICGVLSVEILLCLWLAHAYGKFGPAILLVLFNIIVTLAAVWAVAQMKKLQQTADTLAQGDLEHQVDTAGMYWLFKSHGENLNAIAKGMNKAVEQKMRSEHLKTELITNVSHDIKTPLTSIVNYVDLLQKPHTEAEQVQYLEVLQRQSQRLKKLTEDLVEASKASTGNIPVELEALQVMELVNQAVEEYRSRLEDRGLEVVTSVRGDLMVVGDGKLLWRILDNLLSNAAKYAMSGTRVYVTAVGQNDRVTIAVKNISSQPLDLDTDDLMERFVRGDLSRHTEGSGLGLNIARSLTKLQNGEFKLTIDGDLFKAEVTLPCA